MSENQKIVPKKLDPYSKDYQKAKLPDLIGDAVARKDMDAIKWLEAESAKKENRTRKGTTTKVNKNIGSIRAEYAKKFLGFKVNNKKAAEAARKRKAEKVEKERLSLFEEARKLFE